MCANDPQTRRFHTLDLVLGDTLTHKLDIILLLLLKIIPICTHVGNICLIQNARVQTNMLNGHK
jgi:hypothetical protein